MIWLVLQWAYVDKKDLITGENIKAGDVLIGMAFYRCTQQWIFSGTKGISDDNRKHLNTYYDESWKDSWRGTALLRPESM